MRADFSLQALATGILVAFVGFGSSFAVILQGLTAAGATQSQAASGLMALSIAMGVCAIIVSLWTRLPISIAWSTPGAALLATSNLTIGFNAAVGAFLATGALIVAAGLFRPLGRWVAAIPAALANAMLAGVLLGLCLAPVRAVAIPTKLAPIRLMADARKALPAIVREKNPAMASISSATEPRTMRSSALSRWLPSMNTRSTSGSVWKPSGPKKNRPMPSITMWTPKAAISSTNTDACSSGSNTTR